MSEDDDLKTLDEQENSTSDLERLDGISSDELLKQELEAKIKRQEELIREDEEFKKNFKIETKILIRMLAFILCSFIYITIYVISISRGAQDIQTKVINSFVKIIMYICFGISFLSIIALIIYRISDKIKKAFNSLSFKIKNYIFNSLDWFLLLPICTIIASICFCFLFTIGSVDGSSMYPTYSDEDTVFISYLDNLDRGDPIVAYITVENNIVEDLPNYKSIYPEYYIKRIIGVPGDKITWINGVLVVNDEVFDESSYLAESQIEYFKNHPVNNFNGTFKYKKNGVIETTTVVPDDYYFVMGDNRVNSRDSRMIGLIPKKNIIGVVKFKLSSKANMVGIV